ncbi:Mu transposase C-terminal domain-containing protein [Pseudomonas fluorescens]|uniref:Uncharacterized protein n=1 Tax=Pseudomonas fluorescens TaxID=294 RepID=A0A5E7JC61_PSEFL|nr:Mu transposase C-terminal domain-containing protein [Pseudomonas fluorescens]VVO85782.1 hypothetical protein PS854_02037 [Pseudomonas fluorescens]
MSRNRVSHIFGSVHRKAVERCSLMRSTGCLRQFKNANEHDVKAGDGIVSYGQRTVSKDGSIRFGGVHWQNDELKPFAGFIIGVCMGDYWMSHIDIYWPHYPSGEWLLRLHAYEPAKESSTEQQ